MCGQGLGNVDPSFAAGLPFPVPEILEFRALSRTKNQPKEEVFGTDIPRTSGGHSRGYPGPKLRSGRSKSWKNKHFGADIHDPKARTSTTLRGFQKLRSEKLWAESSFPTLFVIRENSPNFSNRIAVELSSGIPEKILETAIAMENIKPIKKNHIKEFGDAPEASQGKTRDVPGTPGTFGPICVEIPIQGAECPRDRRDI